MTNSQPSRGTARWPAALLYAATVLFVAVPATTSHAQGVGPHFGVGQLTGKSAGLDDGYTRLGAFLPLWQPQENWLLFSDTNLLLYNEQSQALGGNLGGGLRYYDGRFDRVFGGYAYYDFRDRGAAEYDQVGFGVETLGRMFDGRLNVNLPTDTDMQSSGIDIFRRPDFGGPGGQNIVIGGLHYQQALRTVDVEAGALLLGDERWQLKGFAGAYGLFADGVNEYGTRGRVELRAYDQVWIGGYVQNDDIFGTTAGATLQWRFGTGCSGPSSYCCVCQRLGDPVQRRNYVAVQDVWNDILATNGGAPITVLHVDSNAAPGGSGGVDDPLNVLNDASNQPQDIVFVHGDSIFNGESIVISTPGQRLLGEGVPHTFVSDQGTFRLPRANRHSATPQILGSPGDAVTIAANGVEVSGLAIDGAAGSGIFGDGVSDFDINRNTANNNGVAGIFLDNVNGAGSITDNIANNNQDAGIAVVGDMTGDIAGNTANDNTAGPDATGILIIGDHTGNLVDNTANGNRDNGIAVIGSILGNITGNTANNTLDGSGINVTGDMLGNLADNTANGNDLFGIELGGDITGNITGNTTNENLDGGLVALQTITGDISGNIANDNLNTNANPESGYGIFVGGAVTGDLANNQANANASHGIFYARWSGRQYRNECCPRKRLQRPGRVRRCRGRHHRQHRQHQRAGGTAHRGERHGQCSQQHGQRQR